MLDNRQDGRVSAAQITAADRSCERLRHRSVRPRAGLRAVLPLRHRLDRFGHRWGSWLAEASSRLTDHGVRSHGHGARSHQLRDGPRFLGGRSSDASLKEPDRRAADRRRWQRHRAYGPRAFEVKPSSPRYTGPSRVGHLTKERSTPASSGQRWFVYVPGCQGRRRASDGYRTPTSSRCPSRSAGSS